ncbi:hypothetical protein [Bacillus sp. 1P06AnD]|uniref:hypothetical protein n=1 Tax=Bacillus sp. 1P06AnD TaxID=3132208 RepID=UPI0039A159D4
MGIYSIVNQRASANLGRTTDLFKQQMPIYSADKDAVRMDGSKFGFEHVSAFYKVINKWMGRIYILQWHFSMKSSHQFEDQLITLSYSGKKRGKVDGFPSFRSKQNHSLCMELNKDKELLAICKLGDYEKLSLSYSKKENRWTVQLWPNYGEFIWILIPPIRYYRKPEAKEVEQTKQLFNKLAYYLSGRGLKQNEQRQNVYQQ